ncbi:MAG: molybdopterin molybdotransferase MoeA [Bacteroidota bacterium]
MISVKKAEEIILSNSRTYGVEKISMQKSLGRILQEEIRSDRPFPPFNRVMMDGIAIDYKAWKDGVRSFKCEDTQAAGEAPKTLSNSNHCIEIMTGAVLPHLCDTVIRYEDLQNKSDFFSIGDIEIRKGQNVHPQGSDLSEGEVLIEKRMQISAAEIGVLASVGKCEVIVSKMPKVAVISTGDELVEVDQIPEYHQIRRSNVYSMLSGLKGLGVDADTFHLEDERDKIEFELSKINKDYDVVLLSGGVSKGKFDFIPEVLDHLGVKKLFHGVFQRPGKPFWFGNNEGTTFFAFPGNPVSTFMCFRKYFVPWLRESLREKDRTVSYAILDEDFHFSPQLNYFLQVKTKINKKGNLTAKPIVGRGSGDFGNLLRCNGFLELPSNQNHFEKGEAFPFIPFR